MIENYVAKLRLELAAFMIRHLIKNMPLMAETSAAEKFLNTHRVLWSHKIEFNAAISCFAELYHNAHTCYFQFYRSIFE